MSPTEQPTGQVEGQLPESVKEQTKEQFEKLLEHNKEMAQKLAQYEQQPKFNSVLDEMPVQSQAFNNLSATQAEDLTKGLVDENGYIDQDLLNRTLSKAQKEAQEAKDRAMLAEQRMEKFEETQIVRDVHAKHPALDPYKKDTFDENFYLQVRDEMINQSKKGYRDFQAAADKVAAELKAKSINSESQQKAKEEEQKKVISQREQASTVIGGGKAPTTGQYEDLEEGSRKGDTLSIGQLLQANGY